MILQAASVGRYFFVEWLGSVIRFPYWWETDGLMSVVRWMRRGWKNRWRQAAIGLWARSLFVPMYGQYDWTGRLLSVVMRFVVLFARLFVFAFSGVLDLILLVAWFFLPLVAAIFLIINVMQAFVSA